MDYSLLINSIPLACAVSDLIFAINFYRKTEFIAKKLRLSFLLAGLSACIWNLGLSFYSSCYDFNMAKYGLSVVIVSFNAFYIFIVFCVDSFIGLPRKRSYFYIISAIVFALIDIIVFGFGNVHEFVRITEGFAGNRTAYYTFKCPQAWYHLAYIGFFAILWNVQMTLYCLTQKIKRKTAFWVNSCIGMWIFFLMCIPDTVLPVFNIASFPLSGAGVTLGYFVLMTQILKTNAFNISKENLVNYILDLPEIGFIVLDYEWNLNFCNDFSKKLLGISEDTKLNIKDIFNLNDRDIKSLSEGNPLKNHVTSKTNGVSVALTSAVVKDKYDEPFCYILTASDMTYEEEKVKLEKAEIRQQQIDRMLLQIVDVLGVTIDAKDQYTKGHSSRVSKYSVLIAKELGYNEEHLEVIKYAGLLHDIGKIGVPDSVLNKPDKLTESEFEIVKNHAKTGANILSNLDSIPGAEEAAHFHHERVDGKGYPDGLKRDEIPLISRIIAVADAYDAMNSSRVYRKRLNRDEIRKELIDGKGSQFDPDILDVVIKLMDRDII